jgi:hypothetical protein
MSALVDKGRPELGQASGVGSVGYGGISERHFNPTARDASRQSIDHQIKSLKDKINCDLVRLANALKRGKKDQAIIRCIQIVKQRETMLALVARYNDLEVIPERTLVVAPNAANAEHKTELLGAANAPHSRNKVRPNVRRYKTWSDR